MAAFDGFRVKDRSAKVARRRSAMPINGRGVFAVQAVIARRGRCTCRVTSPTHFHERTCPLRGAS